MSWLPVLLIVWIAVDVLIVAAVHFARRAAIEGGPSRPATRERPSRRPGHSS